MAQTPPHVPSAFPTTLSPLSWYHDHLHQEREFKVRLKWEILDDMTDIDIDLASDLSVLERPLQRIHNKKLRLTDWRTSDYIFIAKALEEAYSILREWDDFHSSLAFLDMLVSTASDFVC